MTPDEPVTLAQIMSDLLGRELSPEEIAELGKPLTPEQLADMMKTGPSSPPRRVWPPRSRTFYFPEDGQEDFRQDADK